MTELLIPRYGESTLADVMPSVAAQLMGDPSRDRLSLPTAKNYVLVMVDGLGYEVLSANVTHAPFLSRLLPEAKILTSGIPSTTATSLSCLGTGLCPGSHGIVGYTFRDPDGRVMNALTFDTGYDPMRLQPIPTMFERMEADGIHVNSVSPQRFVGSGLTTVALRGGTFFGVRDEKNDKERRRLIRQAVSTPTPTFTYVYERFLDHTGHGRGVNSHEWRSTLTKIDAFIAQLRQELGDDVCLLITGDHGMIDVPRQHRLVIEEEPSLSAGLDQIGGEGRFRQLYTGEPEAVKQRWARMLGERAQVLRREEAIEAGWYGAVRDANLDRIGDVVVAMATDWAIMSLNFPGEFTLVGMHGSLTPAEMRVPLLIAEGGSRG